MKKIIGFTFLFLCVATSFAQISVLDGVYTKSKNNVVRKPVPYVELREVDIMWAKRIWRVVDMKEKMNQVFYYPETPDQGRKNLITVLMEGIRETGNITAYNPDVDDMFTQPMTVEQVMTEKMTRPTVVQKFNETTMEMEDEEVMDTLNNYDITRFEIKEEVFFDKQRSVLETRILGICPLVEEFRNGEFIGYRKLFWVYFPEARPVLAQNEVYNRHNDVHRLTFDDVFLKRMFSSTVTKESNVYNRKLSQYKAPLDAVLEAEQIEEEIFHMEHDLWSF